MLTDAEFYRDLAKRNPREISIRFAKNSVPDEYVEPFQGFVSAATNLAELKVAWDNDCAERILRALIAAAANPASRLNHITLHDDKRPINAERFDFVGLLFRLARRDPSRHIQKIQLGHNNYGESWWFTLQNREREQILDLNELAFPNVRDYETFLADVLDSAAGDGVFYLDLYLSSIIKYLTYSGIKRMFETIGTKYRSLKRLSLKMTPQDNDYCGYEEVWEQKEYCEETGQYLRTDKPFPYEVVISAIADAIGNCPEIEEIDIELGTLTKEHEIASKQLADAITKSESLRVKRKAKLKCWVPKFIPWTALPDKEWIEIPDSESGGDY
ncbi:hypothetical protein ACHAXT_003656 [Thalassiosira profunda]